MYLVVVMWLFTISDTFANEQYILYIVLILLWSYTRVTHFIAHISLRHKINSKTKDSKNSVLLWKDCIISSSDSFNHFKYGNPVSKAEVRRYSEVAGSQWWHTVCCALCFHLVSCKSGWAQTYGCEVDGEVARCHFEQLLCEFTWESRRCVTGAKSSRGIGW